MSQPIVLFVEIWQRCITDVMTQIAAKPVSVSWEIAGADAIPPGGDEDLWVRFQTMSLGDGGELAFHIRATDALVLSQVFMGERIDPVASLTDDSREAVAEASRQIAGRAATELKKSFPGCELTFLQEPIPSWTPEAAATFRLACDDWSFSADVLLNAPLAQHLTMVPDAAPEPVQDKPVVRPDLATSQPESAQAGVPEPALEAPVPATSRPLQPAPVSNRPKRNNLDLLLDVNLDVTLRFGQRQMTLHDILQLRSGSVIELDRQTEQPVDLLLDDRIIARGEVVVVDGSYGLRISQICSRSERAGLIA